MLAITFCSFPGSLWQIDCTLWTTWVCQELQQPFPSNCCFQEMWSFPSCLLGLSHCLWSVPTFLQGYLVIFKHMTYKMRWSNTLLVFFGGRGDWREGRVQVFLHSSARLYSENLCSTCHRFQHLVAALGKNILYHSSVKSQHW